MKVYYDIYKNPKHKDDEQKAKSHVRIINNRTISEKTFNEEIRSTSSLSPGDVTNAISALHDTLVNHLSDGEKVKLRGIGTFSLAIECPTDLKDDGTYFPSGQIQVRSINFRPDKELIVDVSRKTSFQHYRGKVHSVTHTEEEELQILKQVFANGGSKTLKELSAELEYNRIKTDYRVKQLIKEGYLRCIGTRNIYYYEATDKLVFITQ